MTNVLLVIIVLLLLRVLYNQASPRQAQESRGRPKGIIEWSFVIGWVLFVVWVFSLAYRHWAR
jgi:hypothetical protein